MDYRIATIEEIEHIYNTFMIEDFPPAELKPLESIKYAVKRGWYKVFTAYDGDTIKGYANIADCGGKIGFLDYYAIVKEYRGTGVGSEFFKALSLLSGSDCIILETESVESSRNKEEETTRKRRIAFYEKSGCMNTGCMYNVFGVEYNLFINRSMNLTAELLARILSAYEYAYAAILRREDKDYIFRVK